MIFATPGCKEEFPPYEEPQDVLQGEISKSSPDTLEGYWDPLVQQYFINTPAILHATIRNVYDNLLQGEAHVEGQIVIQSFGAAPRTFLVPLSTGDLRKPPVFQGNIALPPDSAAEFSVLWLPISTDGHYAFVGYPHYVQGGAEYYGPIGFLASAEVQLFQRVQPIRFGQLQFQLVFKVTTSR
ncbi:MAG TPA: hypothetical protein DGH68_07055 [Bacteroidetes bacterium]|nr:hypothetical protein [Bacteroidota bacterium]